MAMVRPSAPSRPGPPRRLPRRSAGALAVAATGVALLVLLAGPLAGAAGAHADVVAVRARRRPTVLDGSPTSVKIWFSEGVDVRLGWSVRLRRPTASGSTSVTSASPCPRRSCSRSTRSSPDGSYIVTWRAVSEDGHPIQGTWTFQVGAAQRVGDRRRGGRGGAARGPEGRPSGRDRLGRSAVGGVRRHWRCSSAASSSAASSGRAARDARATRRIVTAGWIALTASTIVGVLLFGAYSRGGEPRRRARPRRCCASTLDTRFGTCGWLRLAVLLGRRSCWCACCSRAGRRRRTRCRSGGCPSRR